MLSVQPGSVIGILSEVSLKEKKPEIIKKFLSSEELENLLANRTDPIETSIVETFEISNKQKEVLMTNIEFINSLIEKGTTYYWQLNRLISENPPYVCPITGGYHQPDTPEIRSTKMSSTFI